MMETITAGGMALPLHRYNTVVIGTGAAGYNAALRLHQFGQQDIAILTEGVQMGTSRNTGSDKQTYYKLTLCGDTPDAPRAMAEDLFAGKCVDGDIALAEAALSVRAFLHLCELGVDFPTNRYGEYIGYKTDHDPRARATSVGPLTSRRMTECLQAAAVARDISVWDGYQAVAILKHDGEAWGVLALRKGDAQERFAVFASRSIVYATGGPAGIYADTVYPQGHHGATGIAFEAGVRGRNLTEWQYGLASLAPRWNVSGTYMQVLPRFVSVDADGGEHFFLESYFEDAAACLSKVFRKGYEWPFDCRKALEGSSVVDLLVYREVFLHGRRVYLDYRENPYGQLPAFDALDAEAYAYLRRAEACFGTPLERLLHMNAPAYELYLSKGVDLRTERLEIALCAQHNNGGLDIDAWWQTNVPGLFAVGEAAGSHGVYRPGGSALNAGQVGSLRAAQYIAAHRGGAPDADDIPPEVYGQVDGHVQLAEGLLARTDNIAAWQERCTHLMSAAGAAIRDAAQLRDAMATIQAMLAAFPAEAGASLESLSDAYRLRDALLAQQVYLAAMLDYLARGGASRGSAIYTDAQGQAPAAMEPLFRFSLDDGSLDGQIQLATLGADGQTAFQWRPVRPIPQDDAPFETVWRAFREHGNIL